MDNDSNKNNPPDNHLNPHNHEHSHFNNPPPQNYPYMGNGPHYQGKYPPPRRNNGIIIGALILLLFLAAVFVGLGGFVLSNRISHKIAEVTTYEYSNNYLQNISQEMGEVDFYTNDFEYDTNEVSKFKINVLATNVRVYQSNDTDKIRIMWSSESAENMDTQEVYLNGDELVIKENRTDLLGFGYYFSDVEILVPALYSSNFNIETISGTVEFSDTLNFERLEVETVSGEIYLGVAYVKNEMKLSSTSGDIYMGAVTAKEIDAETVSGGIIIEDIKANKLEMETVSGSINTYNTNTKETKAETVSGWVYINTPEDFDFKLDKSSVSGQITYDKNKVNKNSDRKISVSSISGAISID